MINSTTVLRRLLRTRILQNFHLVWLDENINDDSDDYQNSITQLQQVVNTVNIFTDTDECIDFVTDITEEATLMIVSEVFSRDIFSVVQDIFQIKSIYVTCKNKTEVEQCEKKWAKFHGAYTDITSICEKIRGDSKICDHNAISFSFIKPFDESSVENLDTLDCSFMYTQILKDILLTIDFTQEHINEFLVYCREQFADSKTNLKVIQKIEKEYNDHSPIWWYTCDIFLYGMLNRALRVMDVNVIIKIGFFLRDVHCHITKLHDEQFDKPDLQNPFTVYRGQSLSVNDFKKLKSTKGGLLSFNNFLSTSSKQGIGNFYADSNLGDPNVMVVLFVITVDPSISVTSFASITSESNYGDAEGEILFSMHSIFRIVEVKQVDDNPHFWQAELTLTNDNDPQLMAVMKTMEEETSSEYVGWYRLGKLLIKLGQYDKAQELYETLLGQTNNQEQEAHLYNMLGAVYKYQGNSSKALRYYTQSLQMKKKISTSHRPIFIQTSNAIANVCNQMGQYSQALEIFQKHLQISEKRLPANHPVLANIYSGIGRVYMKMKEYSKALEYTEKALEIAKEKLPATHPTLAASYNNAALALHKMNEHSKAIEYQKRAMDIRKKILPSNHPDLVVNLNTTALEYSNLGEYLKALELYETAKDIWQQILPENHPHLAIAYDNICSVYIQMNENSKALAYCEKGLEIREKIYFQNHPDLAVSYNQLGKIYRNMNEHTKSVEYLEKAIEILQRSSCSNDSNLANAYGNLGGVYRTMGEYEKSIIYFEKTIEIFKNLSSIHSGLGSVYNSLGLIYKNMHNYSKAIEYCEKAIEIFQKTSHANDSNIGSAYVYLGDVYKNMNEYARSIEYYNKAIEIFEKNLPSTGSKLAIIYNTLGVIHRKMKDYPKALVYYQKNLEISQKTLSANDVLLAVYYNNIAHLFKTMSNYEKALEYFQRALDIRRQSLVPDHPDIASLEKRIENIKGRL